MEEHLDPQVVQRDSRREVVLYEAASEAISLNSLAQLSRRELPLPCGNREEHDEGPESLHLMITSRCATRGDIGFCTFESGL